MIERALAQVKIDPKTDLPGSDLELNDIISGGINIFLGVIAVAAFASLIYSGFLYITAGGDAAIATKARKNILWALIAVVLALTSFVIVRAVADLPGFSDEINKQTETKIEAEQNNGVIPTTPPVFDDIIE